MDLRLRDARVIIVGGASGIGWACVREFLTEGARVAIWDRADLKSEELDRLPAKQREQLGFCRVDISDATTIEQALEKTLDELDHVDHVVHTAAIGSGKYGFPFTNLEVSDWPKVLEINVMGMVRISHALAPVLQRRSSSSMCFIGSIAGQIGSQTDPPYSASKAANINFAQCLAKDLAKHGVRVNIVNPGMVQTPLNRGVWQAWHDQQLPEDRLDYDTWAGQKIERMVPLGRWQSVEDIADMVVFLASDRAHNVTGQCINVDGGFVMHW